MMEKSETCANCGATLQGQYCAVCGEKRLQKQDRRLAVLLSEALSAAFDLDGRLIRSVRTLLCQPGQLTADWMRGRRRRWLGPVTLFLLVNVIIFLIPPLSDFNLSLYEQTELQPWGAQARALVEARLAQRDMDLATYTVSYETISGEVGKSLLVVHVPFLALLFMLVCGMRRLWFVDYLVLALHEFTALLMVILVSAWIVGPLGAWLLAGTRFSDLFFHVLFWTILTGFFMHAVIAAGRVLPLGKWRRLLLFVLMPVALVIGHFCYRCMQFVITFAVT